MILRNRQTEPTDTCFQVKQMVNEVMQSFREIGGVSPENIAKFSSFISSNKSHIDRCTVCSTMFRDLTQFMNSFPEPQQKKQGWFGWIADTMTTQVIGGVANHMFGKAMNRLNK